MSEEARRLRAAVVGLRVGRGHAQAMYELDAF
jgi:hypothetical protein